MSRRALHCSVILSKALRTTVSDTSHGTARAWLHGARRLRPAAARCVCAILLALALPLTLAATPPVPRPVIIEGELRMPARDGIELAVRIWHPEGDGRHTVVMQHTPYLSDETHDGR